MNAIPLRGFESRLTVPAVKEEGLTLRAELWENHGTDQAVLIHAADFEAGPVARTVTWAVPPEDADRITSHRGLGVVYLWHQSETFTVEDDQ